MNKSQLGVCCQDNGIVELEPQLEMAQRLGFKRVQIAMWVMEHINTEHARQTKKLLEKYDLHITELWCGWTQPAIWNFRQGPGTVGLVPAAFRFQRVQDLLAGAAYARELGVTDIITHLGFIPPDPANPDYQGMIHVLKYLTDELKKYGQVFSMETGQEPPVLLRRVLEDVGAENVGINYDPANLMIYGNGNPVDGLDLLGTYVRSIHAKDGTYPISGYVPGLETVMGEGQVDLKAFVEKLRQLDYKGPLYVEHERENVFGKQKEKEILHAKKYMEALL